MDVLRILVLRAMYLIHKELFLKKYKLQIGKAYKVLFFENNEGVFSHYIFIL